MQSVIPFIASVQDVGVYGLRWVHWCCGGVVAYWLFGFGGFSGRMCLRFFAAVYSMSIAA
jgi:hypothetical protein